MNVGNIIGENMAKPIPVWKKLILFSGVSVVVIVLLLLFTSFFLENKLKEMMVAQINSQVNVPVKVDGGINLSLFKYFPYASVTFKKVSIADKIRKESEQLLNVKEISFLCNIFSLFGSEIEFSKMVIRGGEINLLKDKSGKSNFDIFKKTALSNTKLAIQLKQLQIKDIKLTYLNQPQATNVDISFNDVLLKGNFNDKSFRLDSKGKIHVNEVVADGNMFVTSKNISAEIAMDVNRETQKYSFTKGEIAIEKTEFSIAGFLIALKDETQVNFKLLNEGKDIQQLFSLFPQKYRNNFAGADGSGQYALSAAINGAFGKSSLPKVDILLNLKNSQLKFGKYNKLLKQVNATAKYESDENGNDKIIISNFNCTLNSQPFNFQLSLVKLSNPTFNFYANGVLQLSELSPFIADSVVQDIDGAIMFNNFHLQGCKNDFYEGENSTLQGSGNFKLSGVEFRANGITYGNINGLLKYENQTISAQDFTLNFLENEFDFSGTIANIFPYVYNLTLKRKANEVVLGINGKVKAETFNLTAILNAYQKKNLTPQQTMNKINIRDIFSMAGNVDVDIDKFIFRKMEFDNLKTNLQIAPGVIRANDLNTTTMGGNLRATGVVRFTTDNALNLKLDVSAIKLDIPKIFYECEDFGQSVLTGKNLKGTLTTSVSLNATWNNYKVLDAKTLSAIVDFKIQNGELIKFELLRAASKFIRVEELQDIRFADLENTIKIADSRIDIPEFEIKSSALNLMFFGFHSFDNTIDYHFKINLHKLLAQKFNRRSHGEQYIENDPYEGVNVYLSMTGNLSNPKIKFDKASTRHKIQSDFRNEKTVLRDLLKNTPKKTDDNEQKREDKYFNVKQEPQFMDFDTTAN